MKNLGIISTIFSILAVILNVAAIIVFSSGGDTSVGGVLLSSGSCMMILGITLSRKQNESEEKEKDK